ncbi:MAG: cysteine synthase family protein [Bacillota bacterium]|nr:cysteine synthase family protein [Bacillota bacterium]
MDNKILTSILEAVGRTPLVNLSRITSGVEGQIFAKIEYFNPGFGKKDRIGLQIVEDAERDGRLRKGQTVIELTSGSTGIGLAIACAIKGYPFIAVMSRGNSMERARMMRAFGAKVVLVDQAPGSEPGQVSGEDLVLVEQETQRLQKELKAFRADQFNNRSNVNAHELHTGEEIWTQSGGTVDVFVDFAGTAGSFVGCMKALRKHNPDIRGYVVEPATAAYLAGKLVSNPNHKIQGGGYCMDLPFLEDELVEDYMQVTNEEAIDTARRLAREEAVFGGFSSGANVAAALKLLKGRERGKNIAVIIPDSGLKYMSTDLFE